MKRTICLLLAILLLAVLTGCWPEPSPATEPTAPTASVPVPTAPTIPESSLSPSSAETLPPTEPVPETEPAPSEPAGTGETQPVEETEAPLSVEEAVARYQLTALDYEPLDREAETAPEPVPAPRYTQGPDGIWRSGGSDGEAVLMVTGDLMCQTKQQLAYRTETGYDFRPGFDYVRPVFAEADLVIGNLEATLSESAPYMAERDTVEGRPHLNAPASWLEALRDAGFDLVTMANNHNCDTGVRGIFDTLERVEEYGLIHTGTFRSEAAPRFTVVDVDGIRIGVLSYATYYNHKDEHLTEEGRRSLLNRYSKEAAARDTAAARAAGAEFVLVFVHWGKEYTNEPTDAQYRIARELADAGADYIIGSHPHALQPYDVLTAADGRAVPVVYSMGNFISHQYRVVCKDTLILRVVLRRDETGAVVLREEGYIPCRVFQSFRGAAYVVIPVVRPYNQGLRSQYFHPAYERITGILGPKLRVLGEE